MFHLRVKGSYYDMGRGYGATVYKHGFRLGEQPSEKLEFGRKSESEVKRIFPEVLDEIRGFAEACHVSYDQMAAFMFSIGAFKVEPNCSVFASFNGSDVVFGRNYDFFYSFKKYTESYLTCPEDGHRSLGHTDIFIGREDGINEKGLAIGMTGVESKGNKPGISFCLALRCVLDKCANVEEGTKVLSNAHFTSTFSFLLADTEANLAVVEASPTKVRVRKPEKDERFMVCTNHFVHPEMQETEDLQARATSNWDTLPRYNAIYNALKDRKGKIDLKVAQGILANHDAYICSHQQKMKLGTIWSVAATLRNLQILRAEGHPCRTKYKPDIRLNKAIVRQKTP